MQAFDAEREMNQRRAEAKALGDQYVQLVDFHRSRRRFFLGALLSRLAGLGRRWYELPTLLPQQQSADQRP
jgi:hypothetical protein